MLPLDLTFVTPTLNPQSKVLVEIYNGIIYILYKMNIWRQFNLANQSFLSD